MVRFTNRQGYEAVLFNGPWLISDHCLHVQRWVAENFMATTVVITSVPAWVRFPMLLIEYYSERWLERAGNRIDRTSKVDDTTLLASRWKFALVCVDCVSTTWDTTTAWITALPNNPKMVSRGKWAMESRPEQSKEMNRDPTQRNKIWERNQVMGLGWLWQRIVVVLWGKRRRSPPMRRCKSHWREPFWQRNPRWIS